jgi:quercetin dioxygenase-like cupin family protein
MAQDVSVSFDVVAEEQVPWVAHPRFADIQMKPMLTSVANPLASVSRVRVPPGGVIGWHQHASQTETVYVLAGDSTLTLGATPVPFSAGQIVAIPPTVRHTLVNDGAETVELLCFFTPPIA